VVADERVVAQQSMITKHTFYPIATPGGKCDGAERCSGRDLLVTVEKRPSHAVPARAAAYGATTKAPTHALRLLPSSLAAAAASSR